LTRAPPSSVPLPQADFREAGEDLKSRASGAADQTKEKAQEAKVQ